MSIEELFREYHLDNPAKKASFVVGMLVDYLLMVQRIERRVESGKEPFWKSLHGLRLDEKKVKEIFHRVIAKLREYRRETYLEEIAGRYLANAGENWGISKDEISYYFTLGLTLRGTFQDKIGEGEEEE
jgi:CRISPR-associated protein Csh1